MNLNNAIKIKQSNANVNIRVVPVNEYTKKYSKEIYIKKIKSDENQQDILQFMDDSTSNYNLKETPIFLQQIVNKKVVKDNGEPQFGKGSTFKREKTTTKVKSSGQTSYAMTIDKGKAQRQFKTVPQQLNTNSNYMILVRKDQSTFEAHSIDYWYKINPYTKLDINAIEEKEREYTAQNQNREKTTKKLNERYKSENQDKNLSDGELSALSDSEVQKLSDTELEEKEMLKKRNKKNLFQRIRHGNAENEESDIDDHQGDEVDYMTDESADEDQLSEDEKEKLYSIVDVDQEEFLKDGQQLSDESDEEEKKDDKKEDNSGDDKDEEDDEDDEKSDDGSEDDDSADEIPKQKLQINNKSKPSPQKRPNPGDSNEDLENKKRKISESATDEISEEMRRNLRQRPLIAKDLFKILLKKKLLESNDKSKELFLELLQKLNVKTEIRGDKKLYRL